MLNAVFSLVKSEHDSQNGEFIKSISIDGYLNKLQDNAEFIINIIDGKLAGFIAYYCNNLDSKESYITLIITDKSYRGLGIGNMLIDSVLSVSKARGFKTCALEVAINNVAAINLYKKKGFTIFCERQDSYIMKMQI